MKKVKVLQALLTILLIVAFVLLTGEIFGEMRPLFVKIYAVSMWVTYIGTAICAFVGAMQNRKKNKEK